MLETREIIEGQFIDYFNMTIEQFERLDYYSQKELINRGINLRKKQIKLKDKLYEKNRFEEIFNLSSRVNDSENLKMKVLNIFKK